MKFLRSFSAGSLKTPSLTGLPLKHLWTLWPKRVPTRNHLSTSVLAASRCRTPNWSPSALSGQSRRVLFGRYSHPIGSPCPSGYSRLLTSSHLQLDRVPHEYVCGSDNRVPCAAWPTS